MWWNILSFFFNFDSIVYDLDLRIFRVPIVKHLANVVGQDIDPCSDRSYTWYRQLWKPWRYNASIAIECADVKVSLIHRYWGCDFPQLSMEICKFEVLKTDWFIGLTYDGINKHLFANEIWFILSVELENINKLHSFITCLQKYVIYNNI